MADLHIDFSSAILPYCFDVFFSYHQESSHLLISRHLITPYWLAYIPKQKSNPESFGKLSTQRTTWYWYCACFLLPNISIWIVYSNRNNPKEWFLLYPSQLKLLRMLSVNIIQNYCRIESILTLHRKMDTV